MIVDETWRTAALLILIGLVVFFAYRSLPEADKLRLAHDKTTSVVIYEQILRAQSLPDQDILFIGDSSCLMGIHVERLAARLPGTPRVASLCSIAYLGPTGYARMLRTFLVERKKHAGRIVVVIHPDQVRRRKAWDAWVRFVDSGGQASPEQQQAPLALMTRMVEQYALDHVLSLPMKGTYGLYYGPLQRFRDEVTTHGVASAPAPLGPRANAADLGDAGSQPKHCRENFRHPPTALYFAALDDLRALVAQVGAERFLVLFTPVPSNCLDPEIEANWARMKPDLVTRLGLAPEQVIDMPVTYPLDVFESLTHLDRNGRLIYTDALAEKLSAMPVVSTRE
ncbi:MAG: hypothetical protein NW217_01915 [Hyphomicrobiaceae bacterium]|nr:hypothetical protein [Hyphomicrobiaceae bacterium]